MTSRRALGFLLPLSLLFATLVLARSASADMLPRQACDQAQDSNNPAVIGLPCDMAGEHADEPGICVETTCGGGSIDPELPDAAPSRGYTCYLCEAIHLGPTSPVAEGGTTSGGSSDGGTTGASHSSGGCAMTPLERDGSVGGLMLVAGLFAFAATARRRKQD